MRQKITTYELVVMALLAAILCVSSYINIPLPFSAVPITAQLLVVFMIALLLRPKCAMVAMLVWFLLGLIGLPVFSGGNGGIGALAGPTGGYALGYLVACWLVSVVCAQATKEYQKVLAMILIGLPIVYLLGALWLKVVTGMPWTAVVLTGVVTFVPGDVAKAVAAIFIVRPLRKYCTT